MFKAMTYVKVREIGCKIAKFKDTSSDCALSLPLIKAYQKVSENTVTLTILNLL